MVDFLRFYHIKMLKFPKDSVTNRHLLFSLLCPCICPASVAYHVAHPTIVRKVIGSNRDPTSSKLKTLKMVPTDAMSGALHLHK